jgi:hypothetical protein
MIQAVDESPPAKPDLALKGLLFRVTLKDHAGRITEVEKRFDPESESRDRDLIALRGKLDRASINFETIEEHVPGKGPERLEVGVRIRGESIRKCVAKGADLFGPVVLSDVTFQRIPGQHRLVAAPGPHDEDTGPLRQKLNEHGIEFENGPDASVIITEKPNLRTVALCGGRFSGSEEYLSTGRKK